MSSNKYVVFKDQGQREYMEDRVDVCQSLIGEYEYYGVFDGHGGSHVVDFVSLNMRGILRKLLLKKKQLHMDEDEILYQALQIMSDMLPVDISRRQGTTAVIVLRKGANLWVANCGDTRAVIVLNNGGCVPLTYDHKPNREDEYMRIVSLGGFVAPSFKGDVYRVNGSLAVSRSIGDLDLHPHVTWKPEITHAHIAPTFSNLFIATDGIWDVMSNNDICKMVMFEEERGVLEKIASIARKRGSTDNIAMVLVKIPSSLHYT
jgi:serine/threonine protein phosphatase PrpC